ncbi:MAG: hypothetical protein M3N68_01345 [Actinomycetota bacterium]|nr:hypothetical protein [Actinomycetota bacterium]
MAAGGATTSDAEAPGFCPWCGTPATYRPEDRAPLWQQLAEQSGTEAPAVMEQALHTDAFVGGCEACRRVSHVIGHEAQSRSS